MILLDMLDLMSLFHIDTDCFILPENYKYMFIYAYVWVMKTFPRCLLQTKERRLNSEKIYQSIKNIFPEVVVKWSVENTRLFYQLQVLNNFHYY